MKLVLATILVATPPFRALGRASATTEGTTRRWGNQAQRRVLVASDGAGEATQPELAETISDAGTDDLLASSNLRWQEVVSENDQPDSLNVTTSTIEEEDVDVPIETPFTPKSSNPDDNNDDDDVPPVPRLFPLTRSDYAGFLCAAVGLMVAAGGGIGGGGILVPIYLLLVKLPVKYAISTTSVTILGGGIANVLLNSFKHHPVHKHRSSVDWVLTLLLEPTQMGGTLVGTLLHDFLPDVLLIILLLAFLSLTAFRTLDKANQLHAKETQSLAGPASMTLATTPRSPSAEIVDHEWQMLLPAAESSVKGDRPMMYKSVELAKESSDSLESDSTRDEYSDSVDIAKLTLLFAVITALNLFKGSSGASSSSPSSNGWVFWTAQATMLLIIVRFVAWERALILSRRHQGKAIHSDIEWDERSTVRYPALSAIAGVVAGLFGIGGGIVMGPLMLELGVPAQVAAATSAAMILYTSATASLGYLCFGRLLPDYSLVGLLLGFGATLIGQTAMTTLLHRHQRPSYIAYCIGIVVAISAVCTSLESVLTLLQV